MTREELIQKRNEFSKQYRQYEDDIARMNKEIVKLRYRIDEYMDKTSELNKDIMMIDMCL